MKADNYFHFPFECLRTIPILHSFKLLKRAFQTLHNVSVSLALFFLSCLLSIPFIWPQASFAGALQPSLSYKTNVSGKQRTDVEVQPETYVLVACIPGRDSWILNSVSEFGKFLRTAFIQLKAKSPAFVYLCLWCPLNQLSLALCLAWSLPMYDHCIYAIEKVRAPNEYAHETDEISERLILETANAEWQQMKYFYCTSQAIKRSCTVPQQNDFLQSNMLDT